MQQARRARARRQSLGGVRFLLPVLLTVVLGILVYQLPLKGRIPVGELGDRLFLRGSEAQRQEQIDAGDWYADELSPEGRSRWSRARGTIRLAGIGQGQDITLTLHVAGWPDDAVRGLDAPQQPEISVLVDGALVGTFIPTAELATYRITVPAATQKTSDLLITLQSSATFTSTQTSTDRRPKGIRLDALEVETAGRGVQPDWSVIGQLAALALLGTIFAASQTRRSWLVWLVGIGTVVLGMTALGIGRLWLAAMLPTLLLGLTVLVALANTAILLRMWKGIGWRLINSRALDWGLIAALLLLAAYMLARLVLPDPTSPLDRFNAQSSDRIFRTLLRLSLISLVSLVVLVSIRLLPGWLLRLRHLLLTERLAGIILGIFAGVWLGYEAWLIYALPFVGHADYADNAVVARNLLRGRGWVVDYVTQFYELVPGGSVTRPQETWPLLQPLLMTPAMAIFGPNPFAARLLNIVFMIVLTLLIYGIGARIWDRRVGLVAAILTLTNIFFFRLVIFANSDIALVVWSMAAFWFVFQAVEGREMRKQPLTLYTFADTRLVYWLAGGVFTGLMILQKPSAAIMVLGIGVWALWAINQNRRESGASLSFALTHWFPVLLLWTFVTLLVVSPYIVRNMLVFGKPFFSTEAYDAWLLYFRGTSTEAWEDIYKVYAPELTQIGVPNRSWILRWGFDLTINKLVQQARDAWLFFAPPKGQLLGWDAQGIAGTWLALLGLATLGRRQRRLVGLVGVVLMLYTLFLVVYWHTHGEPRYFVPFVPWLALVAAWGACWLFDRIAAIGNGRWASLGGLVICLALSTTITPHYRLIDGELDPDSRTYWGVEWAADLNAFAWLKAQTPEDAVIMTRVPWQLNYHAERPAVMIPNADYQTIMRIARYYGADYLLVNASPKSLVEKQGGDLQPLASGVGLPGWTLVYESPELYGRTVRVYRFPPNYDGAQPIETRAY